MKDQYLLTIRLIERLHRRFLDVVKAELDRLGMLDINNVQALILSNISNEQVTVGELTARGYYQGSNVSYNVKKLVENGYLVQERSAHDKRMMRVWLSDKGLDLVNRIDALYQRDADKIMQSIAQEPQFKELNRVLTGIERHWSHVINFGI